MNNVKFIKPVEVANLSVTGEISGAAVETLKETIQQGVDASAQIAEHNTSNASHNDLRVFIADLTEKLNAVANSDDTTLDQLSEIVAYIKDNRDLIDSITTSKVNVADIINNLTTSVANKPLSANMGVELKKLIDAIKVPTKVSDLTNDKGYITSYTETDPTVPAWAKSPTKPSYEASEVGADASGTAANAVSSHNTASNAHSDIRAAIPTKVSSLENDKGYLTGYTETDPTVPSHVKTITANNITQWNNAQKNSDITKAEIEAKLTGNITSHSHSSYATTSALSELDSKVVEVEETADMAYTRAYESYGPSNKPPYPVTSVNGQTGAVTISVPTKTSELTNDSNFLTAIPSEYVTETELNNKKYLTSIPSEYVTETELNNKKYLTSIPSEYVTETELTNKGYATQTWVTNTATAKKAECDEFGHNISDTYVTYDGLQDLGYITEDDVPNEVQIGSGTMGTSVVLQVDPSDNTATTSVINTLKAYVDDEVTALESKINNQSIEFATTEDIKALTDICLVTIVQYCDWLWGEGDYGVAGKYSINTPITSLSQINSLPEFNTILSFKKTDVLYITAWAWDVSYAYSISEASGCTVEEMECVYEEDSWQSGYYVLKITPTSNKARIRLEYSE